MNGTSVIELVEFKIMRDGPFSRVGVLSACSSDMKCRVVGEMVIGTGCHLSALNDLAKVLL